MIDMFASASTWFGATLKQHAARAVTITNRLVSPTLSITLPATAGVTQFDEVENDGVVVTMRSRDWLVAASDLVNLAAERVLPARGWIVTDSLDGSRYEIYAPTGQRPWRYSDTSHQRIRIHSRDLDE